MRMPLGIFGRHHIQADALEPQRFPLLRYFVVASITIVVIATLLSALLFVRVADANFRQQSESQAAQEAAHFAAVFHDAIWTLSREQNPDTSVQDIDPEVFQSFANQISFALNIVQVSLLDTNGVVVQSTDPAYVGTVALLGSTFAGIVNLGIPTSYVSRNASVRPFGGAPRLLDVTNTIGPLSGVSPADPQEGQLIGALEIVRDITDDLAAARSQSIRDAVLGSVLMGSVLFALLFLITFRADRTIGRDHQRLVSQQAELAVAHEQNVRAARLAAVGELVSGVAHELNNPLSGIQGIARILKNKEFDETTSKEISLVHQESERAVRIVRNLLAFARSAREEMTYGSINEPLQAAIELRREQLRLANIELVTQLDPALPNTVADSHEIQQVALNLIVNAEQAMTEASGGGRLLVKSEKSGSRIRFLVSDNGPGIPQHHQERLFDPFFTTKGVGQGTGLGLSICYGIVEKHGGTLRVVSEPSQGATFIVELPIMADLGETEQDGKQIAPNKNISAI